jgi:outer membrane protein assembly factor BamB
MISMHAQRMVTLIAVASATVSLLADSTVDARRAWPQWRGPLASGVAPHATPPLKWSETTNVRWKVEVPGRGSASPVVWGDRIFLSTAVPVGVSAPEGHAPRGGLRPRAAHQMKLLAIDRKTGRTIWERTAREEVPHEATHADNGTWASSSAVTDGEHVIASFESRGIYAYDLQGRLVWQKDLGDKQMRSEFGEGSTPVLHGRHLVIVWDHQGDSFITALEKSTGTELWRVARDEIDSWATPLVVRHGGRDQVVTGGMKKIRSYDLETGALVWESAGTTMNPIPSPVFWEGMVFLMSGFRGNNLKAIRLEGAKGDITSTPNVAWSLDRDTPYVPSPVVHDGILYVLKSNNGILTAFDARTGTVHYQQRIDSVPNVFASPVLAAGRLYVAGREGSTAVIRHGTSFELLAENRLDDGFDASPALVDGELFLRGTRYLYAIAEP